MKSLTSGVAVITYNGLKYLPQQLDSILAQTRRVDHIVVSDDRSTDGTWEYLQDWAQRVDVRVTLLRADAQLGVIRNFEQAVSAVEADIVFSSDQDDVWIPNKVELLAAVFERDPDVLLVHTDALLVDAEGRDMGRTLLEEIELSVAERAAIRRGQAFQVNSRRNVVTGATAAFRSSLVPLVRPFPASMYHDAWLALWAAALGKVELLDVAAIHYRQHGANVCGVKKQGRLTKMRHLWWAMNGSRPLDQVLGRITALRADVYTRMSGHPGMPQPHVALASEALAFIERRGSRPGNPVRRTGAVLRDARYYGKFSHEPWADALRDVLKR